MNKYSRIIYNKNFISVNGMPLKLVKNFKANLSKDFHKNQPPLTFLTPKDCEKINFRRIEVPFVDLYSEVVEEFKQHHDEIIKFLSSEESDFVHPQKIVNNTDFENVIDIKCYRFHGKYGKIIRNNSYYFDLKKFAEKKKEEGFTKTLHIDIERFYESIYTHYFGYSDNQQFKWVDDCIRKINGNRTMGIPTGPLISKVASEIFLCIISKDLSISFENIGINPKEIYIFRFADDFTIFLKNNDHLEKVHTVFSQIFKKYMLNANSTKMKFTDIDELWLEKNLGSYDFEEKTIELNTLEMKEYDSLKLKYFFSSTYWFLQKYKDQLEEYFLRYFEYIMKFSQETPGALPLIVNFLKKIDSLKIKNQLFSFSYKSELVVFWLWSLYKEEFLSTIFQYEDCSGNPFISLLINKSNLDPDSSNPIPTNKFVKYLKLKT